MFDCGCHDNDTSDAPNMAFFVRPPRKPTTTQKNSGGFKNLFPTLLHFLKESLLNDSAFSLGAPVRDIFKCQFSQPFSIFQLVKSLPFYIPPA